MSWSINSDKDGLHVMNDDLRRMKADQAVRVYIPIAEYEKGIKKLVDILNENWTHPVDDVSPKRSQQ
jgi:hypothetical protein